MNSKTMHASGVTPQKSVQVHDLEETVESIVSLIKSCEEELASKTHEKVHVVACKRNAVQLMELLKDATKAVSGLLEQTKEGEVTSSLNAFTYYIDDMYRRLSPRDPVSLTASLRDERVDAARDAVRGLEKDAKVLVRLKEKVKGVYVASGPRVSPSGKKG